MNKSKEPFMWVTPTKAHIGNLAKVYIASGAILDDTIMYGVLDDIVVSESKTMCRIKFSQRQTSLHDIACVFVQAFSTYVTVSYRELLETNQRLNRKNQQLEHEIRVLEKSLPAAVNRLRVESTRAASYANQLREIYRHRHATGKYWIKCWCCRFRHFIRDTVWNVWFAIKDKK